SGPLNKVATFILDKDFVGTSASWRPIRVSASLLIGIKYWIVLKKVGDVSNCYEWYHDNLTAGENAYSDDGSSWTVQTSSYQMAYKTHFEVPILAVRQDYASRDDYEWREHIHTDPAIMSRAVARTTALMLLEELKDLTPTVKKILTRNQTVIPDRGKMVTIDLSNLNLNSVSYEVKKAAFAFEGGIVGTRFMEVELGRSAEEAAELLMRLRADIDRTMVGTFGVAEGLVSMVEGLGPDAAVAGDDIEGRIQA
ncbi:unnamed protein product, partial [marine sediment metagenome]